MKRKLLHHLLFFSPGQFAYPVIALLATSVPELSSKIIYSIYIATLAFFAYILVTVGDNRMNLETVKYIFSGKNVPMSSAS